MISRRSYVPVLAFVALFGASVVGGRALEHAQADPALIAAVESPYNSIQVVRQGTLVSMRFGANKRLYNESVYNPGDPGQLPSTYTRMMTVGLAYARDLESVLEIGAGGGRTAWYLHKLLPQAQVTTVELDPEVIRLARAHFGVREEPGFTLANADGRLHLSHDRSQHDLILVDAYRGPFVPFHLTTREFYGLAASRLRPGGVLVQNVEPSAMMFDAAVRTFGSVFANVDFYPAGSNVVMVGYQGPRRSEAAIRAAAVARQAALGARYDLRDLVGERKDVAIDAAAPILTDDFAPVEMLKATQRHNRPRERATR
jgi:spermidine synthase